MSRQFWMAWAKRFRVPLALIAALTLLASIAALALPWLAAQLLSGLLTGDTSVPSAGLGETLALLIGVLIALTALTIAAGIVSETASARILTALREDIYAHVQHLPIGFHEGSRRGDVLALTSYEVENLSEFLAGTLASAPAMILTAMGSVIVLFVIDPAMAVVVPILIPISYLALKLAGRSLRSMSQDLRAAEVDLIAAAERDLEMLPAIKSFAAEAYHYLAFSKAAQRSRKLAVRQARLNSSIGPAFALLAALGAIAVLVIGGERLSDARGNPGEVFAFLLYAALLTRPIGGLAGVYSKYQIARGSLARLESVLGLQREPGYRSSIIVERAQGSLAFESVDFAYPGRSPVLTAFNLEIRAGEIVALTGPNGAGKSTIAKLLLRYHDADAGRITLDGRDIRDIQIQSLRRQFGFVPQQPLLFNASVADNIAFGRPDADPEDIVEAARLAQASEFIAGLTNGFDTLIGDQGVRISGGQRQRIALARALFHDPPIYILDEATSMYDLDSEAAFVEDCVEALKDRTVIIITHRPQSLALASRVLRLDPDGVKDVTDQRVQDRPVMLGG